MKFKDCIAKNGWISPSRANPSKSKPKRKGPKTLTLNNVLIEEISKIVPENKRSALIDYILSSYFEIKYEDAYPESYAKSYGEKRYWDSTGYYKSLDIKYPGRFSTKTKRKKQFSYKDFMLRIKE